MLVVLYGSSCVGKTTIMHYLRDHYKWKLVPVYTTRLIRNNESDKIHLEKQELLFGKISGIYLLNECYGNYYGTPTDCLKSASASLDNIWCLDFQYEKRYLLSPYRCYEMVVITQDRNQLIQQIYKSGRESRKDRILEEYETIYSRIDSKILKVINYPDRIHSTCKYINDKCNSYFGG